MQLHTKQASKQVLLRIRADHITRETSATDCSRCQVEINKTLSDFLTPSTPLIKEEKNAKSLSRPHKNRKFYGYLKM